MLAWLVSSRVRRREGKKEIERGKRVRNKEGERENKINREMKKIKK